MLIDGNEARIWQLGIERLFFPVERRIEQDVYSYMCRGQIFPINAFPPGRSDVCYTLADFDGTISLSKVRRQRVALTAEWRIPLRPASGRQEGALGFFLQENNVGPKGVVLPRIRAEIAREGALVGVAIQGYTFHTWFVDRSMGESREQTQDFTRGGDLGYPLLVEEVEAIWGVSRTRFKLRSLESNP